MILHIIKLKRWEESKYYIWRKIFHHRRKRRRKEVRIIITVVFVIIINIIIIIIIILPLLLLLLLISLLLLSIIITIIIQLSWIRQSAFSDSIDPFRHLRDSLDDGSTKCKGLYLRRSKQRRKTCKYIQKPTRIWTRDSNVRAFENSIRISDCDGVYK
jgi:hypothetical protein